MIRQSNKPKSKKTKPVGRNYIKKTPERRECACCRSEFFTTHPKQSTCLKRECQAKLRERNFDKYIESQHQKIIVKRAIEEANRIITERAVADAQAIIKRMEANGKP